MFSLVVLSVWRWAGYYAVIIFAALQGVPTAVQEAARIDGAGYWQVFERITLPLITPAVFFVVVNSIISSLQVFEQMFIMTQGGPSDATISTAMFLYQQGFLFLKMGYASSVAWFMFVGIFAFTFVNWLLEDIGFMKSKKLDFVLRLSKSVDKAMQQSAKGMTETLWQSPKFSGRTNSGYEVIQVSMHCYELCGIPAPCNLNRYG